MHDFSRWNPTEMNFKLMKETTSYYKEDPKGVEVMCRAFEEVRNEANAEERIANIRNLMESLKITAQHTMDLLRISSSEQKELSAKI